MFYSKFSWREKYLYFFAWNLGGNLNFSKKQKRERKKEIIFLFVDLFISKFNTKTQWRKKIEGIFVYSHSIYIWVWCVKEIWTT